MIHGRLYPISVILLLLIPAAWAALPRPSAFTWYWPFMNYPMYSRAHAAGEETWRYDLRAGSCHPDSTLRTITFWDVNLPPFRFFQLKARAANEPPGGSNRAMLVGLARGLPEPPCRTELWGQRFVLGRRGVEERNPPWHPIAFWRLAEEEAAR